MVDWKKEAVEAALSAYHGDGHLMRSRTYMRAALDAAVKEQFATGEQGEVTCQAIEASFDKGLEIGRAEALEEAAKLMESNLSPLFAEQIRALKDKEA